MTIPLRNRHQATGYCIDNFKLWEKMWLDTPIDLDSYISPGRSGRNDRREAKRLRMYSTGVDTYNIVLLMLERYQGLFGHLYGKTRPIFLKIFPLLYQTNHQPPTPDDNNWVTRIDRELSF